MNHLKISKIFSLCTMMAFEKYFQLSCEHVTLLNHVKPNFSKKTKQNPDVIDLQHKIFQLTIPYLLYISCLYFLM